MKFRSYFYLTFFTLLAIICSVYAQDVAYIIDKQYPSKLMLAFNTMMGISFCSIFGLLVISFVAPTAKYIPAHIKFFVVLLILPLLYWTILVFAFWHS